MGHDVNVADELKTDVILPGDLRKSWAMVSQIGF
jgi:hypothetical protein